MKKILLFTILFLILLGCGNQYSTPPSYIKQFTVYKEGDGLIFYFILANDKGEFTSSEGFVTVYMLQKDRAVIISKSKIIARVIKNTDFIRTKIGRGIFEHEVIACSLGRLQFSKLGIDMIDNYWNFAFELEFETIFDKELKIMVLQKNVFFRY